MRSTTLPLLVALASLAACQSDAPRIVAADVSANYPAVETLAISVPVPRGPKDSASDAVLIAVDEAASATRSLTVLQQFLGVGGEERRGLAVTIALEGVPRVADPVVRFLRLPSRLDVEHSGAHVCFYLQYDAGGGFDPDSAIGESHMLIEGSTVVPAKVGTRASPNTAHGLANPALGYLRFHFNHRAEDADSVRTAAQLDYDLVSGWLNLSYFTLPAATGVAVPVAFYLRRLEGGGGLIYASERGTSGLAYRFLAQYGSDASLAVWRGDGSVWACYDGNGVELGNQTNPAACSGFKATFVAPPTNSAIWPALPKGIP